MDDKIFKLISNISTLVTFDISFIKVNHTFIGDDSNFTYFQQNLSHNSEQLNKLLIFPFTINDHLKGHFIVKAKNPFAKEQVDLIKSFLRASSSAVTSEGQHVSVLYPLADQELMDFLFILRNTKFSKGEGSTPPPRNLYSCLLNQLLTLKMPYRILTKTYQNH